MRLSNDASPLLALEIISQFSISLTALISSSTPELLENFPGTICIWVLLFLVGHFQFPLGSEEAVSRRRRGVVPYYNKNPID